MIAVFIYLAVSLAVTVSAFGSGFKPGFSVFGTVVFAIAAGAGLKGSFHAWRKSPRAYSEKRIAAAGVLAVMCLALALWIGRGFTAGLYGYELSGPLYGLIGFVIALLFVPGSFGSERLT